MYIVYGQLLFSFKCNNLLFWRLIRLGNFDDDMVFLDYVDFMRGSLVNWGNESLIRFLKLSSDITTNLIRIRLLHFAIKVEYYDFRVF